jgi:hypothetical protein
VWFQYAQRDLYTKECDFYTQSVISSRRVWFLHENLSLNLRGTNVFRAQHERDFNTHKSDFYMKSAISTHRVLFYTQSVISTHMSVILTRDYDTLECDLYSRSAIPQYTRFETVPCRNVQKTYKK